MLLHLIGNLRPPTSTENDFRRTLEQMGHTVICHQEDRCDFAEVAERAINERIDALLWTRTWSLDASAQRAMLAKLKDAGIPTVALHLDLYIGLPRETQITTEPWWGCSLVYTADGGHQEEFAAYGIDHHWMQPAVARDNCGVGTLNKDLASDVLFVGSVRYHPEWPHRKQLVRFLQKRYRDRFRLVTYSPDLWGQGARDLYASAKVVVGDSCFADTSRDYWSNRASETLGAHGCLVHPEVNGLEDHYSYGEHFATYKAYDFPGLGAEIDALLANPERRAAMKDAGMAHVLENHTFHHRMQELMTLLAGRLWQPPLREGTFDGMAVQEIYVEDVYRARQHIEPDSLVVDLGANVGVFALWAASLGARVIAVEPHPDNLRVLRANVEGSPYADRITVLPVAVGHSRTKGRARDKGFGSGHYAWVEVGHGPIEVLPLDAIVRGQEVSVLKVDIEGAEIDAIAGANGSLSRCKFVTMEYHGDALLNGREADPQAFGRIVTALAETHSVETLGRPSQGSYLYCTRY